MVGRSDAGTGALTPECLGPVELACGVPPPPPPGRLLTALLLRGHLGEAAAVGEGALPAGGLWRGALCEEL